MKRLLFAAALAATTVPALANDVGVSISIGQPSIYGRIDLGGYPQPQIIDPQPRVMFRAAMSRPPTYMHVPPALRKTGARTAVLTTPVENGSIFQNNWYERNYVSRYQAQNRDDQRRVS